MSLYRAETRRLAKRRFTRWLLVGALLVLGAVVVGTAFTNQKVGAAQIAAAEADAERNYQENLRYAEQERQRCETDPSAYGGDCSQLYTPQREEYRAEDYMASTFDFRQKFGDMITTLAAIVGLAAFVIGASYIGAEWTSGGMMNLLLWRPQRLKVLGTKLIALLVGLGAVSVVLSAVWTGIFVLIANLRGTMAGMTAGAWQSVVLTEVRAVALILVAGAIGFGLAALGRHTALALGAAVGAIVVFQFGLVTVLSLARVPFAEAWLLPTWVAAWMYKEITLEDYNSCDFSATQGCQPPELTLTWPMSGGLMALALVLIVGAAMWTMRSRDIT
ncbi:MAG TPA: ABC transporter permease subunit [Actinoplanes sp.]|nr:ABC transporter permease subunit [Actinoplanes sp.]